MLFLFLAAGAITSQEIVEKKTAKKADTKNLQNEITEVWRIVFHNGKGQDIYLDCEVAKTHEQKQRGLMFRTSLPRHRGMIFIFEQPEEAGFWMSNTKLPLSIAYVHEKLFITSIHDMKPLSLEVITSDVKVLYAIETNLGFFRKNHITSGNKLTIYKNPADYDLKKNRREKAGNK